MTECPRKSLSFCRLRKQRIVADFEGGRLTSDGGSNYVFGVPRAAEGGIACHALNK